MGSNGLSNSSFDYFLTGNIYSIWNKTLVAERKLRIAESYCLMDVFEADIENEAILDLDFLRNMNCKIDNGQCTMIVQDQVINIDSVCYVGCSRIIVSETVHIPPRPEKVIS